MIDESKIDVNISQAVIDIVKPNKGLLISLKKTESCCSTLIDPFVKMESLNSLVEMKKSGKVICKSVNGLTIGISIEIFSIYQKKTNFTIKQCGIIFKKPSIDLPPEIIQKEECLK